jgi:acyl-CoA reductase-like NAD-dependent aldehyde dehydrogenase
MNDAASFTSQLPEVPFLSNTEKKLFIDGKWQPSVTGEHIQTFNPATGRVLATLARDARKMWILLSRRRAVHSKDRGAALHRINDTL